MPRPHFDAETTALIVMSIATIALVASGAVIAISYRQGADQDSVLDRLVTVWFLAALAAVAMLTLQPGGGGFRPALPSKFNPISRIDVRDALPNVMLYLPIGLIAAFRWRFKPRPIARATGLALSVSLTVELAQLVLPISRAAAIHDVLFNTVGGFVGAVVGTLIVRLTRKAG